MKQSLSAVTTVAAPISPLILKVTSMAAVFCSVWNATELSAVSAYTSYSTLQHAFKASLHGL